MKYQVTERFDNGNVNICLTTSSIEKAQKEYNSFLDCDGYKPDSDLTEWVIELNKIDDDGDFIETICEQTMYDEGTKDRKNYRGRYGVFYGYERTYKAAEKECVYQFYFQGEKDGEPVKESKLNDWYFK